MTDSRSLEDRLDRLESVEGIRQLAARYALSLDMRDLDAHVNLFAPEVRVLALVRAASGDYTELHYSRSELAKHTFASLNQLSQFASRRPSVNARWVPEGSSAKCDRIEVDSVVIESGLRASLSYRLESVETFTLARQAGGWLAVSAATQQR